MKSDVEQYKEQLERVIYMEELYDKLENTLLHDDVYNQLVKLDDEIQELKHYYEGPLWIMDYDAEENGVFPSNLKRGILSEDALYDLMDEINQIIEKHIITSTSKDNNKIDHEF